VVGVAGTLVGVFMGVGTRVGSTGTTVDTGAAVGASVGVVLAVGRIICVAASLPQDAIRADPKANAAQISHLCEVREI